MIGVGQDRARAQGAGGGIDLGGDIVQRAAMRETLLRHQSDIDRNLAELGEGHAMLLHDLADAQHILLAEIEAYVNRLDLNDGGEIGRPRHAH